MLSNLRLALRSLLQDPGFTVIAVLTMALGVGANTAIFSVVNAVLLHPFPYTDSDRILFIGSNRLGQGENGFMPVTYPDYLDWHRQCQSFEGLAYASGRSFTLTKISEPAIIRGANISASTWGMLGIKPIHGRTFTDAEDRPGADPVCVLSYATWQGRFGGDAQILNHPITLDGQIYTVIGVMPPQFKYWAGDIWLPVGLEADTELMRSRVLRMDAWVVGKPKPGITLKAAEAELNVIAARLAKQYPDTNKDTGVTARLLSDAVTGGFRQPLLVLLGAVACVLLIACANVANLLLARTASRQREYAIRSALGATRGDLVQQILWESIPLALLGGLAGVLLGSWCLDGLLVLLPSDAVPAEAQIQVNSTVMLFSLGLVVVTMLLFSLFPALESSRPSGTEALQEGSRGTPSVRTGRIRAALIVAEVSLSLTLLVGAGLLIRSLSQLSAVDPGFNKQNLLAIPLQLPPGRYPTGLQATAFFTEYLEEVRHLPGVTAAGATTNAPFLGGTGMPLLTEGKNYTDISQLDGVQMGLVMGDYFQAQGLRLIKGRIFTEADRAGSMPVIILNEVAVKRFLPNGDPLGQRVMLGVPENLIKPGLLPVAFDKFQWSTVVGVVRSARHFGLQNDPIPAAYIPVHQGWEFPGLRASMVVLLRTEGDPTRIVAGLRQKLSELDNNQPIGRVATMETLVGESLKQSRFNTILLGLFAAVALALAVVGIYGVVAWNVAQRTREIGIRAALGASRPDVLRLVVGQAMRVVAIGLVLGLVGSFAVARTLQTMLFGVSAFDPWTFSLVALTLTLIALLACLIPSLRATRISPMTALRAD
jgi:putative ABC transport system permease protein